MYNQTKRWRVHDVANVYTIITLFAPMLRTFIKQRYRYRRKLPYICVALFMLWRLSKYRPDPPLRLSGVPVYGPQPGEAEAYFGRNRRFVFFNSWYGQFNNQILALINALSIARDIGAVLVLPCEKLGKESIRDSKHIKMRRLFSMRQMVDSYFNYSLLQSVVPVVNPSDFLNSTDGAELLARKYITTERKSGGFYRWLFSGRPRGYDPGEAGIRIRNPASFRPRLQHWCDFRASKALTFHQKYFLQPKDRFVFLPAVFRHHDLNCSRYDPLWLSVRRFLKPRDEFINAVDSFMQRLPHPIFAIHMRFFLNGDIGNFTPLSFVQMLQRDYSAQLNQAKTIFLAYTPSNNESTEILNLLQETLPNTAVVGGAKIPELLPEEFRLLPLHAVLLDMWVCVKSTLFLGRVGSSLSWNVVYWRQMLGDEYNIEKEAREPLWYTLANFSSTGATRLEGRIQPPDDEVDE